MKMDEYDGKQFLATIRSADYAHAGEAESIDLVFGMIDSQPSWRILDVGCGRGGTADYVSRHGWGEIAGVDIDEAAIEYARRQYPAHLFSVCDMHSIGERFPGQFDLIYLFNVFYAAQDKQRAVASFRTAAKPDGLLCIFDYVLYDKTRPLPRVFLGQTPATLEEFHELMRTNSWQEIKNVNLDEKYIEWYRNFLKRFDNPEVDKRYSSAVIAEVRSKYEELLAAIEQEQLGGMVLLCSAA